MSSVKTYSNLIDEKYPVAGKINDIAQFHTNFSNIKSALNQLDSEINSLNSTGVKLSDNLLFDGGTIENVVIKKSRIVLTSV